MIEEIVDKKTRKTELLMSGVISAVYYNALKEVKNRGKNGKDWFPTHTVSIVVDGDKVGLGLTEKDGVNEHLGVKDADSNWHDLAKGLEVTITVTEGEPYKGTKQYNAYSSDVVVVDASGVKKAQQASKEAFKQPTTGFKKDNTGVIAGNGFNAAKALLNGSDYDDETFIDTAKQIIDIGNSLRVGYAKANPTLNDYEVGAQVGMALIAACEWSTEIDEVEGVAKHVLKNLLPAITEHVKGGSNSEPEKREEEKPAPKKAVVKKTTTKKVVEEKPGDDFDDDIPF